MGFVELEVEKSILSCTKNFKFALTLDVITELGSIERQYDQSGSPVTALAGNC